MLIRATLALIATVALLGIAGGLAVGIGGFLLVIASYVGAALLLAVPVGGLVVSLGRLLDYRLADRAHARLVAYETRRLELTNAARPVYLIDSTSRRP